MGSIEHATAIVAKSPNNANDGHLRYDEVSKEKIHLRYDDDAKKKGLLLSLKEFFVVIDAVKRQFLLAAILTIGVGATKKLSFDAQAVLTDTIYRDEATSEQKEQYKFIAFGVSKAFANLLGAVYSDQFGKGNVFKIGWAMGILHCLCVLTNSWTVTIWGNVFLGIQQGLVWSMLIFTMVDYAGPKNRALAVGINETFGYAGVAVFGKIGPLMWGEDKPKDGNIAMTQPFYYLLAFMIFGLITSLTILADSTPIARAEQATRFKNSGIKTYSDNVTTIFPSGKTKDTSVFRYAFAETSLLNNSLMACCLCGLAINYCSTFAWGLGKTWSKAGNSPKWDGMDSETADNITLTYDLAKGLLQFIFGFYSDRFGRRFLICAGMCVISVALVMWGFVGQFATSTEGAETGFFIAAFLLGTGTAMMYSPIIACVAESADPSWRSSAVGGYRFWRDMGYATGGLLLGYVTDNGGYSAAVFVTAFLMVAITANFYVYFEEVVEGDLDIAIVNTKFVKGNGVIVESDDNTSDGSRNMVEEDKATV